MTQQVPGPDETPTFTLRDKRWYYKGEGNVNVVLAVPADAVVVRVMKVPATAAGAAVGADEDARTAASGALSVLVRYRDAVGRLFFAGSDYTDVPAPMSVPADELRDVDRIVRRDRPPHRRHKGLGWAGGLVAVSPDYTVLEAQPTPDRVVYCVEIKPKQGWSHEADRAARGDPLGAKCAFCAHQYLKLSRGDVREPSRYCPLDLFSGRRERAARAVRELFRTPQNNLKMFVDGAPVDERDLGRTACEAFGDVRRLCAFVADVLLGGADATQDQDAATRDQDAATRNQDATRDHEDASRADRPRCDFDAVPMSRHCVLHKILTMQKTQTVGFAAVCAAYDQRRSRSGDATAQFDHVDRLFAAAAASEAITSRPVDGYLVAATAQDCSVFVTFSRAQGGQCGVVQFAGQCYAVRVKVSDLDPKPLSTIEKHRKRNADVLLAYQRRRPAPKDVGITAND